MKLNCIPFVRASRLYKNGHQIDGLDFSSQMISIAKSKMPNANFIEWDISVGLPPEIWSNKYDSIVSTYTLHHLTDEGKISFLVKLLTLLEGDGQIFIGDISFETRDALENCRLDNIDRWDNDEFYLVYDEIASSLKNICSCRFYPVSNCGGIFIFSK